MFLVQETDLANIMRYFDFDHTFETRKEAAQHMFEWIGRTPRDRRGWIDFHEGKFYYQEDIIPKYTEFNTLFSADFSESEPGPFPDTWESLIQYLETHPLYLGWASRDPVERKIVELTADQFLRFKELKDPKWGDVPYTSEEIEAEIEADEDDS